MQLKVGKSIKASALLKNAAGQPIVPPTLDYNFSVTNPAVLQMTPDPTNDLAKIFTGLAPGVAQIVFTCTAADSPQFQKIVDVEVTPVFPSQVLATVDLIITPLD